ncbi:MAG: type II toxin-antitoxin system RelE/ParE family toxin [Patescibacteria group bacterium]
MGQNVQIYQDENGKLPFIEWLESIKDLIIKARIKNRIARIELGNFGDCKPIKAGIYELRLHFGSGYRVYFGKINNSIVLLLCGGDKSSQIKNIKQAIQYWKNFKKSL